MKRIKLISILIIVITIGTYFVLTATVAHIPVGTVGVRTQEYAIIGKKGVIQEDFSPGWHRAIWPIDSWEYFDSTVQTLEMTRDPSRGDRRGRDDVQVQSADGYAVSVDVTLKYRIQPGKAHKLYVDTGSGERYKTIVRNEAEKTCIAQFGGMKTEDFYNPHVRRKVAQAALTSLQASLNDNYVEVLDLLIRDVQFDPEYERKIQTKKLADQEVEVNKSLQRAREMQGKTDVIGAETKRLIKIIQEEKKAELVRMKAEADVTIAAIKAESEKYATEKKADADVYAAKKDAEGHLLVKQSEAEGERLRNLAMQGVGGEIIVALEAAKNLNLEKVTISTVDNDLLDIEGMASKLGAP
jgi:regulator of protease activity HflC (stomatin/prohibitin superfamily)